MAEKMHHPYVELAKKALETFVLTGKVIPAPDPLPELFSGRAGCFVTLMENGNLEAVLVPLSLFMITLH